MKMTEYTLSTVGIVRTRLSELDCVSTVVKLLLWPGSGQCKVVSWDFQVSTVNVSGPAMSSFTKQQII